jgi:hypothetical protein
VSRPVILRACDYPTEIAADVLRRNGIRIGRESSIALAKWAVQRCGVFQNPPIARFEVRSPIQGRGRVITEPVAATGFRRRGVSSTGDFGSRRQFGGICVHGKEVIRLELGVIGQDLLLGRTTGKPFQNLLNGDPVAANARFAEPHTSGSGVFRPSALRVNSY